MTTSRTPGRRRRARGALAVALFALAASAPAANAATARFDGASADGSVVFFSTTEQLVNGDSDSREDVFERSKDAGAGGEYVTREVSIGPAGGNDAQDVLYAGASADGSRVFFATREPLVAQDDDKALDIYMRDLAANTTTLVSRGAASCAAGSCGNGEIGSNFVPGGLAQGGERVFFATTEKLSAVDTDTAIDVYVRDVGAGTTTLVSQGAASCAGSGCGNGSEPAIFRQASANGETVYFTSGEGLAAGDSDGLSDVYVRDLGSGTTALVSSNGTCPEGVDCSAVFKGASSDGSHAFFETRDRISISDEDSTADVYDWSAGAATLASSGPDGGNGPYNVTYAGNSSDGGAVFFETSEQLDEGADTNTSPDVYRRSGGITTLISTGSSGPGTQPASFKWTAGDGTLSIFSTADALEPADTDSAQDVYLRQGGATTLLSTAGGTEGDVDAAFAAASADGSRVFFVTHEALLPVVDEDLEADIYERHEGGTALVSTGPLNGNGPYTPGLRGISTDGTHVFFTTAERLAEGDLDAEEEDVYQRTASGTLLVSTGNSKPLGPAPPSALTTVPGSPGQSTTPSIHGQAEAGTAIKVYTNSDCSGEQAQAPGGEPAGGSAEQLADPEQGIQVEVAAGSETKFYATAEAEGIVSACSKGVTYRQEDPAPPPPPPPPAEEEGGSGSGSGGGTESEGGQPIGAGSAIIGAGSVIGRGAAIDYVAPRTRITYGPSFKTRRRRPVFRFVDATGQPGSRFRCKLDRRSWRGCRSPNKLPRLGRGRHVLRVRAVNALGQGDKSPSKRVFKVLHGGPRR